MADQAKTEPKSTENKTAAGAVPRADLAPAAESSDPAVHQLLADIQTAHMNGDEDAEKAARAELRKLGFE